jgi:hypothetical protein
MQNIDIKSPHHKSKLFKSTNYKSKSYHKFKIKFKLDKSKSQVHQIVINSLELVFQAHEGVGT